MNEAKTVHKPVSAILLWRMGALGDTMLLCPALAALRAAYPGTRLIVAGNPAVLSLVQAQGLVDRILDAASPAAAPLSAGQAPHPGFLPEGIDVAVVWSARHATIAAGVQRAGVPHVITAPALPPARMPIARYYLETLAPLDIHPVPFAFGAPPDVRAATTPLWEQLAGGGARPAVLLHPGAGGAVKRWPLAHYLALACRLRGDGLGVVWTAGPADDDLRDALEKAGEGASVFPPLDLGVLAAIVERARAIVSGDCGVAHLAALLGVPGVALFGPTDPLVWGPPGPRTTAVSLRVPCAPCGDVARYCPSRICLLGLSVRTVYHALRSSLADAAAAPFSADRDRHPALLQPSAYRWPEPVAGPPAALQIQRWDTVRTSATQPSTAPE